MSADEIIHQSTRLRIMAALNMLERRQTLDFSQLKAIVDVTDGNLGAHLDTLARAGYVDIEKLFVGRRPQTRVRATTSGRRAFAATPRSCAISSIRPRRRRPENSVGDRAKSQRVTNTVTQVPLVCLLPVPASDTHFRHG